MIYLGLAAICALVVTTPVLLMRNVRSMFAATGTFILALLIFWLLFWTGSIDVAVGPLGGSPTQITLIGLLVSTFFCGVLDSDTRSPRVLIPAAVLTTVMTVVFIGSWKMIDSERYRDMIGPVERRVWTQDVQPKDPNHLRLGTRENAVYQAGKVLGSDGAIGSQFEMDTTRVTLQWVNGEMQYIVPVDFQGWLKWKNAKAVPAYIIVHAEDPTRQAELVNLPNDKQMKYTPGAYFGYDLVRHLRYNGFLTKGIASIHLEVDDSSNVWWVVSLYKPTIGWSGEKITGVVLVNPATGDISKEMKPEEAPKWVDRIFPAEYAINYLTWWGRLVNGWWNDWLFGSQKGVLIPETPNLVEGSAGHPVWVTGMTSVGSADQSLVELVYTDTRTGKSVIYDSRGGATDEAVLQAVDKNSQVQFQHLHGADPQTYNMYGHMASVVPLLNENHAFQAVGIVDVKNTQLVAVGKSALEAVRNFQTLISKAGQNTALDNTRDELALDATVSRINKEQGSNGATTYFLYFEGKPHLFSGNSNDFLSLTVTAPGDRIRLTYVNSGEDVMPILKFKNLNIALQNTASQEEVRTAAEARLNNEVGRADSATISEKFKNMSPAEMRRLDSLMRAQKPIKH